MNNNNNNDNNNNNSNKNINYENVDYKKSVICATSDNDPNILNIEHTHTHLIMSAGRKYSNVNKD